MLYADLLQYGHWESFIAYLWKNTEFAKRSGTSSLSVWIKNADQAEEKTLRQHYKDDEETLMQHVGDYFQHCAKSGDQTYCLRCNGNFIDSKKDFCSYCAWDFTYITPENQAGIEINQHLNAAYVQQQIDLIQTVTAFERLDRDAAFWSAEYERMEQTREQLKKEIEQTKLNAAFESGKKENLEQTLNNQGQQIRQLEMMLKNAESLFLPFDDRQSEQFIALTFKGHILHAVARPPIKFPIDLVMGFQKSTDGPPVKTINKTSCFVYIHEHYWTPVSTHEWKVDLSEITKGKVSGDFYINCFSHLHKKDHLTNIRYDIKRLSFI